MESEKKKAYCIPFGEETADLVGSACDYEENE